MFCAEVLANHPVEQRLSFVVRISVKYSKRILAPAFLPVCPRVSGFGTFAKICRHISNLVKCDRNRNRNRHLTMCEDVLVVCVCVCVCVSVCECECCVSVNAV